MFKKLILVVMAVAALCAPQAQAKKILIPDDTMVWFRLEQFLSSQINRQGEEIQFSVSASVIIDGVTIFQKGAPAKGVIVEAAPAKGWGKSGKLSISVTQAQAVDGSWWDIQMEPKKENKNWNAAKTIGGVALLGLAFGGGMKGKKVEIGEGAAAVGFIQKEGTIELGGNSKSPSAAPGGKSSGTKTGSECLKVCDSLSGGEFSTCMSKCTGN